MSYFTQENTNSSANLLTEDTLNKLADIIVNKLIETCQLNNKTNQPEKELLSINDVVNKYGISRSTLNRWERMNYLIPKRLGSRCFYYQSDIDSVLNN